MPEQISVSVDSDVAQSYRSASARDRRRLDILVNLHLREATEPGQPLEEIMAEISRNARRRGLTPDVLKSILDDE